MEYLSSIEQRLWNFNSIPPRVTELPLPSLNLAIIFLSGGIGYLMGKISGKQWPLALGGEVALGISIYLLGQANNSTESSLISVTTTVVPAIIGTLSALVTSSNRGKDQ